MGKKDYAKIAVVFPGMGYTADRPLLYYSAQLAKQYGYEIKKVKFHDLPFAKDALEGNLKAALAQAEEQLEDIDFRRCEEILFLGKSIGTAVAAAFDAKKLAPSGCRPIHMWFTPLEMTFRLASDMLKAEECPELGDNGKDLLPNNRILAFSGTKDQWADHEEIRRLATKMNIRLVVAEDANHSLETGDPRKDIPVAQMAVTEVWNVLMAYLENRELPGNAAKYRIVGGSAGSTVGTDPESSAAAGGSAGSTAGADWKNKRILFLGSSVTYGARSGGRSFADDLAIRNGFICVKEAVSGTTLADVERASYVQRLIHNVDRTQKYDLLICQLSTNDATKGLPLGKIAEDDFEPSHFAISTILGAMEYIIAWTKENLHCPVAFYTGTKYDSAQYEAMVEALLKLRGKWGVGVIDLWHGLNTDIPEYDLYMADPIHPTRAGYRDWWTPFMEKELGKIMHNPDIG